MIEEIVSQLKKRKMIKVKWLQSTEVDPDTIAAQAKARLVEVRGRTMVLSEKSRSAAEGRATPAKSPAKTPGKPAAKVTAKALGRSAAVKSPAKAPAKSSANRVETKNRRQTGTLKPRKK